MLAKLRSRPGSIILVGAALLLGGALVGTAISTYDAVRAAGAMVARGQADLLHDELRLEIGRNLPGEEELRALLTTFAEEQLSYVAVVDENGATLVEVGHSVAPAGLLQAERPVVGRSLPGPTLTWFSERLRVTYRRGPRPRLAQRLGSPPQQLVFEFVPQLAGELAARARRSVLLGGVASLGALLLATLYLRQRRRAEEALRAETSSRRLAELGQMSAVLAHELRNPLASLKGHAQLLQRSLPEGAQREKAELVVGEAVRIERLGDDLLTFVRTGALERTPTDLAALVREVASERGARIRCELEELPRVALDPDRLRQVLVNLLDNALQAGDGPVEVSLHRRGDEAELVVRDYGTGIAPADLARLFQPFFTTKARGTGLGLAVARQIVVLHDGSISADNADGGGARFLVRLPLGS